MASEVANTIAALRERRAMRAAGRPVYLTTDPAWLLDMAINRRAGWVEDPHWRGSCQPVNGKLPRYAKGDAQAHLRLIADEVNRPRLIVPAQRLGEWKTYLMKKIPERFKQLSDF